MASNRGSKLDAPCPEKLETLWYNGLAWGPEDYEYALACIETLQRISELPEAGLGGAGAAPAMALAALWGLETENGL